jgi:predicted DNA-binding protein
VVSLTPTEKRLKVTGIAKDVAQTLANYADRKGVSDSRVSVRFIREIIDAFPDQMKLPVCNENKHSEIYIYNVPGELADKLENIASHIGVPYSALFKVLVWQKLQEIPAHMKRPMEDFD